MSATIVSTTTISTTTAPGVTGYVEAVTGAAVLGWAWLPGSADPLEVELRLGEQVISAGVADQPRSDLARNGIGEGRHAFTLPVPETLRSRADELRVVARTAAGEVHPLGSAPPQDSVSERLDKLQLGLEMLVRSQRVLHRNVQAALLKTEGGTSEISPPQDRADGLAALQAQVATLELFLMRMDGRLAKLAAPAAVAPSGRNRVATATFAVALLAFALALVGLWRSLPL